MKLESIQALVASEIESGVDHSKISADFVRELPEAGLTIGRFIEYIELGKQPRQPYQGKPRDPMAKVRLVFELLSAKKNNIKEIEVDGVKKKVAQKISLSLNLSQSSKASFTKLVDKMRYGRQDIKHVAQMLGEAFLITITHSESKDGKTKYANMTSPTGEYLIAAPFKEDPMTGERTQYACPPPLSDLRVFLFNRPTIESWDSLFIDGTREETDATGAKKEVSKNWIQGTIMKATNFPGSPLAEMLAGVTTVGEFVADDEAHGLGATEELPDEVPEPTAAPVSAPPSAAKKTAATKVAAKPKATAAKPKTADVFANLGVPSTADDLNDEVPF